MKIRIIDPIGIHSGMRYYIDSFVEILHEAGEHDIVVMSNYAYEGQRGFLPNFFQGNSFVKLFKLIYSGIKLFFSSVFNRKDSFIILSYGTIIDFWLLLCVLPAKHLIVDGHEIIHQGLEEKNKYLRLSKFIYKYINEVIIHSDKARDILMRIGYSGGIMFVPHFEYGLDSQYSQNSIGDDIKTIIDVEKVNILFFGSVSYNKGVDILINNIRALPINVKEKLNVIIAGKPTDDTIWGLNMEEKVFRKSLRHINDDEMKFLYGSADYVVLPYRTTYQSGVLEMAFNFKRPVLVSDLPYFKEVLEKYPSFGVITGIDDVSFQQSLNRLVESESDNFYKPEDVYSYHHKPETMAFVDELKKLFARYRTIQ